MMNSHEPVDASMVSALDDDLDGLRHAVEATGSAAPPVATRGTAAVARIRRVIATSAVAGMTIEDLATAVGMTPRGLQDACQRAGARTPMRLLCDARLARARDELRAADPRVTSVQEIAARHGFGNPGRFAGYYRSSFGVAPSQDLGGRKRERLSSPQRLL